jgi:hypothetical protein
MVDLPVHASIHLAEAVSAIAQTRLGHVEALRRE